MCDGMGNGLKDNDTTKPAMEEVVCVEGDVQEGDERVVSPSQ